MANTIQLSASLENYLEAIFTIVSKKGGVRAKDIASHLGVKAGSVTTALQTLARSELINYSPHDVISLTSRGVAEARQIRRKHEVLSSFLTDLLGVDPDLSDRVACKLEHAMTDDICERLAAFASRVCDCPGCGGRRAGCGPKLSVL